MTSFKCATHAGERGKVTLLSSIKWTTMESVGRENVTSSTICNTSQQVKSCDQIPGQESGEEDGEMEALEVDDVLLLSTTTCHRGGHWGIRCPLGGRLSGVPRGWWVGGVSGSCNKWDRVSIARKKAREKTHVYG